MGFENRPTFVVQGRNFAGIPLSTKNQSANGTWLSTDHYDILVRPKFGRWGPSFAVADPSGTILFDTSVPGKQFNSNLQQSKLHWPSPLQAPSYAVIDFPRFFVPEWTVAPIPQGAHVDPALLPTHGYDFRNSVRGDTYIFLLGDSMDSWLASRAEFLRLAGPCPLLPDYAFGTWFTYWHAYHENEAKDDIAHWESLELPLDIYGLDMNWRNTSRRCSPTAPAQCHDWYYDYPATELFPDYSEWFAFLKQHKIRTYL